MLWQKLAGVKRIVLVSPAKNKKIRNEILAAAKLSGVNKAIYDRRSTSYCSFNLWNWSIKKVDKIFGPGNAFVAGSKQVFGDVGIDSIAGPSEVMVIADKYSNPEWVA